MKLNQKGAIGPMLIVLLLILLTVGGFTLWRLASSDNQNAENPQATSINNFDECVAAGYEVIEDSLEISENEACIVPGGLSYIRPVTSRETALPTGESDYNESEGDVVEVFCDFQAPGCSAFSFISEAAIEQYRQSGGVITYKFRHFPLALIHLDAEAPHLASEAARDQGAFDEYTSLLLTRQREWSNSGQPSPTLDDKLIEYAAELNLDTEEFKNAYSSAEVLDRVGADTTEAFNREVTGVPSVFINGDIIDTPRSAASFVESIQKNVN